MHRAYVLGLPLTLFIVGFAAFLLWFALLAQRRDGSKRAAAASN